MEPEHLQARLSTAAFAFRGYDLQNLGRSCELLAHPVYSSIVHDKLSEASRAYTRLTSRPMNLVARVKAQRETTFETYADAVVLVLAMEIVQLELLEEFFGIHYQSAQLSFGYSSGELAALIAGGVFSFEEILSVSLPLVGDVVELARDVTLAVLFSRGDALPAREIHRLCAKVNQQGRGVVGISTHLSPNSMLLMGQGNTLDCFADLSIEHLPSRIHLRKKEGHWAPMHTPIVWEKYLRDRFAAGLHTLGGGSTAPTPPVISLATADGSYSDSNARDMLGLWFDRPQQLWNALCTTLSQGIETVIHVGPQPNIIPATFRRLRDNVESQAKMSVSMRALSEIASRPWLKTLLPARAALLRSLYVQHVILEDWLLAQRVGGKPKSTLQQGRR